MVRQRVNRHVELKRRGKLKSLPKRFRPLLIAVLIGLALIVFLDQQSKQEITEHQPATGENNY